MKVLDRGGKVLEQVGLGASCALVAACASGAPPADELTIGTSDPEMPGCVVDHAPLTIGDGVYAYIEPEDLIEVGSSYVVVGSPSYTWAPGTPGDSLPLTRHRHLAARFTLDGRATLIERPVQDSVGYVRSLPLDGDRWGVLFDIERRPPSLRGWDSVALWYAEHDGAGWSRLEPVPLPDGELDMNASSELVRVGEDLVWIAPVRHPNAAEVLEYTRRAGDWRYRVIGDDWVETSTLTHDDGSGLWMARVGLEADGPRKALSLYHRREADWQLVREVYVLRDGEAVLDPAISILPDGLTVTWRVESRVDSGAYALIGVGSSSEGTVLALDREVLQVIPLTSGNDVLRWLVTHVNQSARRLELRLLGPRSLFGAQRIAATPSPYLAFFAALARTPEEAILVGPEVSSDMADPFVRSLILRLSTSCT